MNKFVRAFIYFLGVGVILASVAWRFEINKLQKNKDFATFGKIYKQAGKPVNVYKVKAIELKLFEKVSTQFDKNGKLIAKVSSSLKQKLAINNKVYDVHSDNVIGHISSISSQIDFEDGLYEIQFKIRDNVQSTLKETVLLPTRIHYKSVQNAVVVPVLAIIPKNNEYKIWVLNENKPQLRSVRIGHYNQSLVQIISGIDINDTVLTNGHRTLSENDKILILQ